MSKMLKKHFGACSGTKVPDTEKTQKKHSLTKLYKKCCDLVKTILNNLQWLKKKHMAQRASKF